MIYCKNHSTLKNRGEVIYFQVHKKSSLVNVYTGTPGKPHKSSLGRSVRPTPTRSPQPGDCYHAGWPLLSQIHFTCF